MAILISLVLYWTMNNYNKFFISFTVILLFIFPLSCAKRVPPKLKAKRPPEILKKPSPKKTKKKVEPIGPEIIEGEIVERVKPKKKEEKARTPEVQKLVIKLPSYFNKKDSSDLAFIIGGYHKIRDDNNDKSERPALELYVPGFYIDIFEITNRQFRSFKDDFKNSFAENCDLCPATGVTWEEAENYCRWAEKRLPSETEWEKAARGVQQLKWPWGNYPKKNKANVLGGLDSNSNKGRTAGPLPVGSLPEGASIFGVFDMAGNVWEWTNSYYLPYNKDNKILSPDIRYKKQYKVLRGGSWKNTFDNARTSFRHPVSPDIRLPNVGFRCAKDA